MKYIQKSAEPPKLTEWKIKRKVRDDRCPKWKRLKKSVKDNVMGSLLEEQGGICCYCCRDISDTDRHIEHFKPQAECRDRFDYKICSRPARRIKNRGNRAIAGTQKGIGLRRA